ncbi:23S rRNA (adenine(2030)-N(6))-methyltransferase RlmJ [Marinospirillum alkaliphilum]|uniref:Ribosomal RNA large subunit methyltransferase J n=1 Tax=Marinospirillum alkaliphilum DSM 21637 TaxID=1122209 RepID=A0A1K1XLW4_9GAMM|nr:23S rRNA (adenine(2030)-N(6))-methyltransferase RlmJ [Marinospirillum alkaliphilum]SFX50052.1 23S rRNA (adenine2030-N6)-methyltransferase [Marinospirillum alkaliphilum DSM 21637]
MLSYRHSFHAGNFADLLKHLTLHYLLDYLNRKDKPWFYLDTHAGAGLYSLKSASAEKTGEYQDGIQRLLGAEPKHPLLQAFRQQVLSLNTKPSELYYPGSPLLASLMMRPQDRMQLHELHPQDHRLLSSHLQNKARVRIQQSDGFAALKASLPPPERRGLILMDPPYELKEDYQRVIQAVQEGVKRFATGTYAIWYPVLQRQQTESWIRQFSNAGLPSLLRLEHCPLPDSSGFGMTGSGMLIINPPWSLAQDFKTLMPELNQLLQQGKPGTFCIEQSGNI